MIDFGCVSSRILWIKFKFWKEVSNVKGGKVESCSRIKDGNGKVGTRRGCGRSILKICTIQILKNRLQSICVALMGFRDVTTSEESLLEELMLGCVCGQAQEWKGCR